MQEAQCTQCPQKKRAIQGYTQRKWINDNHFRKKTQVEKQREQASNNACTLPNSTAIL